MRLTVTEKQRAINAEGASKLLAALDAGSPARVVRQPSRREVELAAAHQKLGAELLAGGIPPEEHVERLRVLVLAIRKPQLTLAEVARKRIPRPHPSPVAYALEKTGDAAE